MGRSRNLFFTLVALEVMRQNLPGGSMDSHLEIPGFSNRCRLFPLPGLVLLPQALLPLHIFEPRYRQMTRDALDGDQLVTMVQIRPAPGDSPWTEPVPIMDVACVGKIVRHEIMPDGRFNILLVGCKRVRLVREIPSEKLYRIADARILDDIASHAPSEPRRTRLLELFRSVYEKRRPLDEDLASVLHSPLSLGALSDILAHALGLPPAVKQSFLAEPSVDQRVAMLTALLEKLHPGNSGGRLYPPPFSAN